MSTTKRDLAARSMCVCIGLIGLCLAALADEAEAAAWGSMAADRILFLGNSVTLHAPKPNIGWTNNWGMAATAQANDYVHRLTTTINTTIGGSLTVSPQGSGGADNIVNIAGTFEQNFATYSNSQLQTQIDYRANLVVLQFGENMPSIDSDAVKAAYKSSLESLMNGLQASSNPYIFVTSESLASNPAVDAIKQEVCTEDLTHRIFVDMSAFRNDWTNRASAEGVFSDPGVQAIQATRGCSSSRILFTPPWPAVRRCRSRTRSCCWPRD